MFFTAITEAGATPALVKTLAFQEARLRMIAEDVANAATPGFRARQLDVAAFQRTLREALAERRRNLGAVSIQLKSSSEVSTDADGFLRVTPSEAPVENVLFHDGTNVSIERQMSELAKGGLMHDLSVKLLQNRMDGLRKAIRGTT